MSVTFVSCSWFDLQEGMYINVAFAAARVQICWVRFATLLPLTCCKGFWGSFRSDCNNEIQQLHVRLGFAEVACCNLLYDLCIITGLALLERLRHQYKQPQAFFMPSLAACHDM